MEISELKKRIDSLANTNRKKKKAKVEFAYIEEDYIERISNALATIEKEEERIALTAELLDVWMNEPEDEARKIFGDTIDLRPPRGAIYTLSGNKKQLRVWYGFPGQIERNHVDSCGSGLLFGVYGYPGIVGRYLDAFLDVRERAELKGKKGVRVFIGF